MTGRRSLQTFTERLSRQTQFIPGHVGGRVASAQPVKRRQTVGQQEAAVGWRYRTTVDLPAGVLSGFAYGGGTWVIVNASGVSTASDPVGTWSSPESDPGISLSTWSGCSGLWYGNGEWGSLQKGVGGAGYIFRTSTPAGTWATQTVFGSGWDMVALFHNGTTWAAAGVKTGQTYIATASSLSGTWTDHGAKITGSVVALTHDGSTWVAAHLDGTLYTASDPSGTWSAAGRIVVDDYAVRDLVYANGMFVALAYNAGDTTYTSDSAASSGWPSVSAGYQDSNIGWKLAFDGSTWWQASAYLQVCSAVNPTIGA